MYSSGINHKSISIEIGKRSPNNNPGMTIWEMSNQLMVLMFSTNELICMKWSTKRKFCESHLLNYQIWLCAILDGITGVASQSSDNNHEDNTHLFVASWAIDGDRSGIYPSSWSCSHTAANHEYTPWWMLDMEAIYTINNVTITARQGMYHTDYMSQKDLFWIIWICQPTHCINRRCIWCIKYYALRYW